jgi:hypothetical protein
MEVIVEYSEVLAKYVKIDEMVEVLKMQGLMSESEELYYNTLERDHTTFSSLIEYLGSPEKNNFRAYIKAVDFIRCTYPEISSLIPEVEHGLRMKVQLSSTKIVTVQDIDYGINADIREFKVCECVCARNNTCTCETK